MAFDEPKEEFATSGRRQLIRSGLAAGSALAGFGAISLGSATRTAEAQAITNLDLLNFALNLEYLEAEFYLRAAFGRGLADSDTSGKGVRGAVTGGRKITFNTRILGEYAQEIAQDEQNHVRFLRTSLGAAKVARPTIDLDRSFTTAARAAGLVGASEEFDAFANETNFLFAAFLFEDVGVTAYGGAVPRFTVKALAGVAARLMAVEAYHAAEIRTVLYSRGLLPEARAISDLRDRLDGAGQEDQGVGDGDEANIVPGDGNALVFTRTPEQVLRIVYLGPDKGGFFPDGMNGKIA